MDKVLSRVPPRQRVDDRREVEDRNQDPEEGYELPCPVLQSHPGQAILHEVLYRPPLPPEALAPEVPPTLHDLRGQVHSFGAMTS